MPNTLVETPWLTQAPADGSAPPPDLDELRRQRITFEGYFTGPTW